MKVDKVENGQVTILRLEGDIDESGVNELRLHLLNCIKDHRMNLVVNLGSVQYVSYLGLGVLVERLRQVRSNGGDLRLVGVNLATDRMIQMAGANSIFSKFENERLAIQSFREAA